MFFKDHFNSTADIIEAKFKAYNRIAKNAADKGELCEIFMKEFLIDSIGDSFKIFRGGRVINSAGAESKQLDIILTGKRTIKIFGDKGIYPTETVFGCCSITATLTKNKLEKCCQEFISIPKDSYHFQTDGYLPKEFLKQTVDVWSHLAPYKCIFAYKGQIKPEWIDDLYKYTSAAANPINSLPDLIVVNKVGMIEKEMTPGGISQLKFISFDQYPNYGVPFAKMLFHMNNFNWEELFIRPDLSHYLNKDLEV